MHLRRVASGERIARHYVPQLRRLAQDHSDIKFESFRYGSLESLGRYRSVAAEEYVAALDEGAYRTELWPREAKSSRNSAIGTTFLPPTLIPRNRAT